jgi:fatty acid desaturase
MISILDFAESRNRPVEWPTYAALSVLWLGFGLLTFFHAGLPWWILTPAGAYLVAFHGSLQHEALHGHPTRSPLINELLVFPPLSLWIPYRRYRKLHLTHHRNDQLTDPVDDPESYYLDPQAWETTPPLLKRLYTLNNTMLGRFIFGPVIATVRFVLSEAKLIMGGDRDVLTAWLLHALGIAIVWLWVSVVSGMPFWIYVVTIAYWGNSITMMRSYAEHRAHDAPGCRVVIVESNPLVSLLYLNNNLHMAHHELPRLPWYKLPGYYRENKERLLTENCAYLMKGYSEIAKHWLFKPKEPVPHPNMSSLPRIKRAN